jgi:hypothetical protein
MRILPRLTFLRWGAAGILRAVQSATSGHTCHFGSARDFGATIRPSAISREAQASPVCCEEGVRPAATTPPRTLETNLVLEVVIQLEDLVFDSAHQHVPAGAQPIGQVLLDE